MNEKAFVLDKELAHGFTSPTAPYSLGIVLVSSNDTCRLCGSRLLARNERTSHITIYTEAYGTIVGTHYHKYCQKFRKGCPFRQYYGYSSEGNQSVIFYDANWAQHKYFVSSSETAFELKGLMLNSSLDKSATIKKQKFQCIPCAAKEVLKARGRRCYCQLFI